MESACVKLGNCCNVLGSCFIKIGTCCKDTPNQDEIRRQQLEALTYQTTDEIKYNFTEAKVISVHDGDTLTIGAYYNSGFYKLSVRIYGVDCDEIHDKDEQVRYNGIIAKKYVEHLVLNKIIQINVLNNKRYNNKKIREKFGRLLAIITFDGKDLADELLATGLARPYFGGKKDKTPLHPTIKFSVSESSDNADEIEFY